MVFRMSRAMQDEIQATWAPRPSRSNASVPKVAKTLNQYDGMTAVRTRKNTAAMATPLSTTRRCERGYFNDSKNHLEGGGGVRNDDDMEEATPPSPHRTENVCNRTHNGPTQLLIGCYL
ncbi:hypothetical protein EYF80_055529 [Liparis tanakae]|uniref:Uncharacterized protein n=1 Tax=Liparis tanakae TaxID=230148 RepID=A0A4Z2EZJ9_9TELE|nr:hypothetical protein EYF80_055529 [Liparis tanakae]